MSQTFTYFEPFGVPKSLKLLVKLDPEQDLWSVHVWFDNPIICISSENEGRDNTWKNIVSKILETE